MPEFYVFLWGFGGSVAIEVLAASKIYVQTKLDMPYRYKLWHFYFVRLVLAACGGGLAIAYKIDNPLLAANIGAATPVLLEALTRGLPASDSNG